jgi:hypothetical protein
MNRCKHPFSTVIAFSAITLLTAGLLHSTTSLAVGIKGKNRTFPYGCRVMGYGYENDLLIIKPVWDQAAQGQNNNNQAQAQTQQQQAQASNQVQTMYLLHNKSGQALSLKAKKDPGEMYKPDNENVIGANQWAAFAMDQNKVAFTCMQGSSPVSCSTVLEICQYNHAKFSESTLGSYWVVKSDTLENTVYGAIHIGILLRW